MDLFSGRSQIFTVSNNNKASEHTRIYANWGHLTLITAIFYQFPKTIAFLYLLGCFCAKLEACRTPYSSEFILLHTSFRTHAIQVFFGLPGTPLDIPSIESFIIILPHRLGSIQLNCPKTRSLCLCTSSTIDVVMPSFVRSQGPGLTVPDRRAGPGLAGSRGAGWAVKSWG